MTEIGFAMPAKRIDDVIESARAVSESGFASFSIYNDLGDMPAYVGLQSAATSLADSNVGSIGPMGISPAIMDLRSIVSEATKLEDTLPSRTYIGLVKGAFLDEIGRQPASLSDIRYAVSTIRDQFRRRGRLAPPIFLGGFGPSLLRTAGELTVAAVKLGGSTNVELATKARTIINNSDVRIVMGAVTVVDNDRKKARQVGRQHVAKYLYAVGELDGTLDADEKTCLSQFLTAYRRQIPRSYQMISDSLLDKFALVGSPDEVCQKIAAMDVAVDRFEIGTPHGLGSRPEAIRYIANTVLRDMGQAR